MGYVAILRMALQDNRLSSKKQGKYSLSPSHGNEPATLIGSGAMATPGRL